MHVYQILRQPKHMRTKMLLSQSLCIHQWFRNPQCISQSLCIHQWFRNPYLVHFSSKYNSLVNFFSHFHSMKAHLVLHILKICLDFSGFQSQESVAVMRRSRSCQKCQEWVCGKFQVSSYFLHLLLHHLGPRVPLLSVMRYPESLASAPHSGALSSQKQSIP